MDVGYTYDIKMIENALVYMLGINAFETISLLLVQCALEDRLGAVIEY